jgi:peptide/nickel transport system permease protein
VATLVLAVTIDWVIPRFMPGNPIQILISRANLKAEAARLIYGHYMQAFGLDLPIWRQYLNFWNAIFHGDLGISVWLFPRPVLQIILDAAPFTLGLLLPAILASWFAGNWFGAFAARSKRLDNTLLPISYVLTSTPYMWLGILLAWLFGIVLHIFPFSGAYDFGMMIHWSWAFAWSVLQHWFLPFISLFLVMFGGWAIGMRNMIIYELESDYSHYLQALGAPRSLIRRYAFRNALLPQITGLALQLGVIVAGQLVTEMVFAYPGVGYLILQAIQNHDLFLLQGCFLFIVIGVLIANFLIDVAYVLVDPRTRTGMQGAG